jgi:hypothetical protein
MPLNKFLQNLLIVPVEIANTMGLEIKFDRLRYKEVAVKI